MSTQATALARTPRTAEARGALSFARRRARERREARVRLARRVERPVAPDVVRRDPLSRGHVSGGRRVARFALYALVALGLHSGVVLGVTLAGEERPRETFAESVTLRVVDPPPLPEPVEPLEVAELEPAPMPPLEPEVAPPAEPQPRPRKQVRPMPADPIDRAEPEAVPDPTPRRRVVGLSMESTVSGGSGPAFAVGNTRMGRTGDVAEDPSGVNKLSAAEKGSAPAAGPNRVAASVPGSSVKLVKPKRLSAPALVYPRMLKAQGIEGNVAVMIRIDARGKVVNASVIKSSGHPEFDEAARAAALKERFAPATRGGDPTEYTLKYTYRFRIKDA